MPQTPSFFNSRGLLLYNPVAGRRLSLRRGAASATLPVGQSSSDVSVDEIDFHGQPLSHWLTARTSADDETRWKAVDAIRHICTPDVSMPMFLETLQDDRYWRSRALAAHAIYDFAWDAEFRPLVNAAVPALLDSLDDASREVREQVIATFELLGSAANASLEALNSIAKSDDAGLADLARTAIRAIES